MATDLPEFSCLLPSVPPLREFSLFISNLSSLFFPLSGFFLLSLSLRCDNYKSWSTLDLNILSVSVVFVFKNADYFVLYIYNTHILLVKWFIQLFLLNSICFLLNLWTCLVTKPKTISFAFSSTNSIDLFLFGCNLSSIVQNYETFHTHAWIWLFHLLFF